MLIGDHTQQNGGQIGEMVIKGFVGVMTQL